MGKTVAAAGAAWELKPERVTEAVPGVGTGAARQSRSHRKLYLNSIYAPETCPKVPAACVSPSVCLSLSVWVRDAPCSPSDSAVILRPVCLVWLTGPALADEGREETPRRGGGRRQEGSPH